MWVSLGGGAGGAVRIYCVLCRFMQHKKKVSIPRAGCRWQNLDRVTLAESCAHSRLKFECASFAPAVTVRMNFELAKEQAFQMMLHNQLKAMSGVCGEYCVPEPGNRMTAAQTRCVQVCASKFMRAYNVISHAYEEQMAKEQLQ